MKKAPFMIKQFFTFFTIICVLFSASLQAENDDSGVALSGITLPGLELDRIANAKKHYESRMRTVRYALYGAIAAIGTTVMGGGAIVYRKSQPTEAQDKIRQLQKKVLNSGSSDHDISCLNAAAKAEKVLQPGSMLGSFSGWTGSLKLACVLGLSGVVLTAGTQMLNIVAGTLEEVYSLWIRGYTYWYNALEHEVKTSFADLRESLQQARKIASSGYDLPTAQGVTRRYASQTRATGMHYRADITTMYQVGLGKLERLISLMYLVAHTDKHEVISRHVTKLGAIFENFKTSLEYDLNENTRGALTHYSNRTMELFHEIDESLSIFLTTYRVYLTL